MEIQPRRRPEIEYYDDRIVIRDVRFQTDFSCGGTTRYCGIIAKECSRYNVEAIARFEDKEFDFKNIMELMALICDNLCYSNPYLDISIKGRREEAEQAGLMLYSSLTSKEWVCAGINRFPT